MRASGSKTGLWNFAIAVITAIVISISMRLVGSLLITALIIFPALSAMRLFKSYKAVIVFSVCFGAVTSFLGIILSIVLETPVGSTIVVTDVISYLICYVVGQILNLRKDVLKEEKVKGEEIKC
jgi:zinc transport system permease protein